MGELGIRPSSATPETPNKQEAFRVNQEINSAKIRLIDENGEMIGVVSRQEAISRAQQVNLDLVEISPNSDPPVCKILNYGKFKYELQKKRTEARKNQKVVEVKEIQLRPMIGTHDLEIKCKAMRHFIEDGNKVKITMRFRGRELSHTEIGMDILKKVIALMEDIAKVDQLPKLEGKQMMMMVSPKVAEKK